VIALSEMMIKVVPKDMKRMFFDKMDALKKSWNVGP
jgi:hypothetical protein